MSEVLGVLNFTLVLNVVAVFAASASVALVDAFALAALILAFVAGVAVTVSSHYAFGVSSGNP